MIKDGTKLRCINDTGQSIVKLGKVYTAWVRDGVGIEGRVHIKEHKRFAILINRFEVVECK